jgi:hypothetical protein
MSRDYQKDEKNQSYSFDLDTPDPGELPISDSEDG